MFRALWIVLRLVAMALAFVLLMVGWEEAYVGYSIMLAAMIFVMLLSIGIEIGQLMERDRCARFVRALPEDYNLRAWLVGSIEGGSDK